MSDAILHMRFVVLPVLAAAMLVVNGCRPQVESEREKFVAALQREMATQQDFVKVHAGEALLEHGYRDEVRQAFQGDVDSAAMPYAIGVWRVMARAATAADQRDVYLDRIRAVAFQDGGEFRVHAIESLGKLGAYRAEDREPLERFVGGADDASAAFARWLLAMSGQADDLHPLEVLLTSPDAMARLRAAFALPRTPKLPETAVESLTAALDAEPLDSPARVYLLSAVVRLGDRPRRDAAKKAIGAYLQQGKPNEQMEAALAIGSCGDRADLELLAKNLTAPEADGRIGAADGSLRVLGQQARAGQ
jgi:SSS family solute:Na+ symporter